MHYGVLGMKWGVRRFYNSEGSKLRTSQDVSNAHEDAYSNIRAARSYGEITDKQAQKYFNKADKLAGKQHAKMIKAENKAEKKTAKHINKAIKNQTNIANAWEKEGNSRYAKANRYVVEKLNNELKNVRVSDLKTRKDVDEFITDKIAVYLSTEK